MKRRVKSSHDRFSTNVESVKTTAKPPASRLPPIVVSPRKVVDAR